MDRFNVQFQVTQCTFAALETDGVFSFVLSLVRIIARLRSYLDFILIILTLNGKQSNLKGNLQIIYCYQMPAPEHVSLLAGTQQRFIPLLLALSLDYLSH